MARGPLALQNLEFVFRFAVWNPPYSLSRLINQVPAEAPGQRRSRHLLVSVAAELLTSQLYQLVSWDMIGSGRMQCLVTNKSAVLAKYGGRFSHQALRLDTLTNTQDATLEGFHYKVFAVSGQAFSLFRRTNKQEVYND